MSCTYFEALLLFLLLRGAAVALDLLSDSHLGGGEEGAPDGLQSVGVEAIAGEGGAEAARIEEEG